VIYDLKDPIIPDNDVLAEDTNPSLGVSSSSLLSSSFLFSGFESLLLDSFS
jgi:hypothetical protein